jgi:hypothetical protein
MPNTSRTAVTAVTVQTHEPKGTATPDAAKGQKPTKPGSSVHIVKTQQYGTFFNGEIVPETIAFSVTGSSKTLVLKLGMTRGEVGAMVRSVNLPVTKSVNTWTVDKTITVEYAKDGKVSKLALK